MKKSSVSLILIGEGDETERIKLGQFYGISHKAMLYRLRNDGYLDAEEIKNMDISVIETASRLGYDTSLYRPLSESKKETVLG
ncbi:zinc metallopeptidase [Streptococcus pneumoniae]|nr:zinc metallopeptidase [Streptococcus pneumoniae]